MGLGYVEGVTHDYVRHGTTTLFAALDIATGAVFTECRPRHRHQEFLGFLKRIDQAVPQISMCTLSSTTMPLTSMPGTSLAGAAAPLSRPLHAYLLVLAQSGRTLARPDHPQAVRRGSFRSVRDLITRIQHFVDHYNRRCRPFIWTATPKDCVPHTSLEHGVDITEGTGSVIKNAPNFADLHCRKSRGLSSLRDADG
jgi:putative transposase